MLNFFVFDIFQGVIKSGKILFLQVFGNRNNFAAVWHSPCADPFKEREIFRFEMEFFQGKMEFADPPKSFKGFPIALITAGLMALCFMGFSGLKVW